MEQAALAAIPRKQIILPDPVAFKYVSAITIYPAVG
jgi:hypothetical protein